MIKVLFFAGIAEKIGGNEIEVELNDGSSNIADLIDNLNSTYPVIQGDLKAAMVAVNEEFVEEDTALKPNDTVAFIPPVSGG